MQLSSAVRVVFGILGSEKQSSNSNNNRKREREECLVAQENTWCASGVLLQCASPVTRHVCVTVENRYVSKDARGGRGEVTEEEGGARIVLLCR